MANMIDYVKYYKEKTFEDILLNDMDALVFSNFIYLAGLNEFLEGKMPISIGELGKKYFEKVKEEDVKNRAHIYKDSYHLFKEMYTSKRYSSLVISNYENIVDEEKQFGAITFRYLRKWVFVAFEGTDTSIVGWKEDFEMSHTYPVPSQKKAIEYLEREARFFDKNIYVGGHSKGGNLSVVAALESSSFVRHRLTTIYNFDGPGLREKEYHSLAYKRIKDKIKMFVPSFSFIGMLLNHDFNYEVIKSDAKGPWQHNAFTWQCFGEVLLPDELNKKSVAFSSAMKEFLEDMPDEEKVIFVKAIFDLLSKAGIVTTEKVTLSKLLKCISLIGDLRADKVVKEKLKKVFGILIKMYNA